MRARIYRPSRNAMQSGAAKSRTWVLEFAQTCAQDVDPLMGWTGAGDTQTQVRLEFDSKQAAEDYAQVHGIDAQTEEPKTRKPVIRPGGYGDNFATNRRGAWTH